MDADRPPSARPSGADPFDRWFEALEARHLARLSFPEIRRSVQALSSHYVERRARAGSRAALSGAGKRAAFALFYGALHFLVVRRVVRALGAADPAPGKILDLGCGTAVASAAWAVEAGGGPVLTGVERDERVIPEARWTYRCLGLRGRIVRGGMDAVLLPGRGGGIVAAWAVSELTGDRRDRLRAGLLRAARRGARVLVIEPISRRAAPWWDGWSGPFVESGGRDDSWRFPADLPDRLTLLDRAAGLDHSELTARSLWIDGQDPG